MDRLVFGMHHLNITQAGSLLDGKEHYSHPNAAIDLAGEDTGIDYWYNKESETYFYCSGYFGNRSTGNTRFFVTCDKDGNKKKVLCADGKERVITLALTHSGKDYQLYKIYKPGDVLYQEGTAGRATGNHIHLEVAEGSQKTKYWDVKMKVYRMMGEMDPRDAFFILDGYTTVVNTQSLVFKHCSSVKVTDIPSLPSYLYGVDISNHQSGIDISKLKNTDFVIVKATQGWNWTDPSFKNLYSQAVKSNKLLGTYYYAMPKNNNAKDDADYYVQEVNKIKGSSKPIFVLDWEEPPTDKVGWAYEWLERVASLTGTTPLIYMDLNRTRSHDWSKVAAKYPLWLAQYPVSSYIYDYAKGDRSYSTPKYWGKPTIWQFTSHGRITGYSGNLDCNIFYGTREDWLKLAEGKSKLSDVELALMVWDGKFGSGDARKKALDDRYEFVQHLVDLGKEKLKDILAQKTDAMKLVKLAAALIGTDGTYPWKLAGYRDAWCSEFVWYCGKSLGFVPSKMPVAGTCMEAHLYYKPRNLLHKKADYTPRPGDIVYFGKDGTDHTGIVEKVSANDITVIEGNAGNSDYTKSKVCRTVYSRSNSWLWGYADPLNRTESEEDVMYLKAVKIGFNIRSEPVNGKILAVVKKGERAKITQLTPDFKSDGYQWAKVEYGSYLGYSQLDTKSYLLEK